MGIVYSELQSAVYDIDADFDALAAVYVPDLKPVPDYDPDIVWDRMVGLRRHKRDATLSNEELWHAARELKTRAEECYPDRPSSSVYDSDWANHDGFVFLRTLWVVRTLRYWLVVFLRAVPYETRMPGAVKSRSMVRLIEQFRYVEGITEYIRKQYDAGKIRSPKNILRLASFEAEVFNLSENAELVGDALVTQHRRDGLGRGDLEVFRFHGLPFRRGIAFQTVRQIERMVNQWRDDLERLLLILRPGRPPSEARPHRPRDGVVATSHKQTKKMNETNVKQSHGGNGRMG